MSTTQKLVPRKCEEWFWHSIMKNDIPLKKAQKDQNLQNGEICKVIQFKISQCYVQNDETCPFETIKSDSTADNSAYETVKFS